MILANKFLSVTKKGLRRKEEERCNSSIRVTQKVSIPPQPHITIILIMMPITIELSDLESIFKAIFCLFFLFCFFIFDF